MSNFNAESERNKKTNKQKQKFKQLKGEPNKPTPDKATKRKENRTTSDQPIARASLPYIKGITDKIGRILKKHNIGTAFTSTTKIKNITDKHKCKIHLENQGVYELPCMDCPETYIGQTNRRISTRIQEHKNTLKHKTSSSLTQHYLETGHRIDFDNARTIASIQPFKPRIIREAIEIDVRPNSMNRRDDSQRLPHTWKHALENITTNTENKFKTKNINNINIINKSTERRTNTHSCPRTDRGPKRAGRAYKQRSNNTLLKILFTPN